MAVAFHNLCPHAHGLRIATPRIRPVSCFSLSAKVNGRKARTSDVSVVSFAAPGLIANLIVITGIASGRRVIHSVTRSLSTCFRVSYPALHLLGFFWRSRWSEGRALWNRESRPRVTIFSYTSSPGNLSAMINNGSVKYARVVAHEWGIWDTSASEDVNHDCELILFRSFYYAFERYVRSTNVRLHAYKME